MFDNLSDHEFKIGDVQFNVKKLNALDAWHMSESIRVELGSDIASIEVDGDKKKALMSIFSKITTLQTDFVNDLRVKLFKTIEFKTKDVERGWLKLEGMEDMAFQNLEPTAIYELLMRSLAVNFTKSFAGLKSLIPAKRVGSKPSKH